MLTEKKALCFHRKMFSTHRIYPHENDVAPTFKGYFSDGTKYTALLDFKLELNRIER